MSRPAPADANLRSSPKATVAKPCDQRGGRLAPRDFEFSRLSCRASSAASASSQLLNATIFGSFAAAFEQTIQ